MNLDRFVAALVNAGLCAEAEEIADVIWLTLHWPGSERSALPPDASGKAEDMSAGRGETRPSLDVVKPPEIRTIDAPDDPPPGFARDNPPQRPGFAQTPKPPSLYTAAEGKTGNRRAHMLRVPTAPALPDALALGRALRPFMRRMPSPVRSVLDEAASAELIAELRLPIPVFRPMPERIFDVALVVEMSASMTVWHRTVAELERLLLRHGAFRDVRRWQISWREESAVAQLFDGAREQRDWRAVSQAPGNRLVLVATDGASDAWRNGAWADILHDWSSLKSVAIVQLLGERLSERTPIGRPTARLMPSVPSVPNHVYFVDLPPWQLYGPQPRVTVPVIFLDGDSMSRWARATMGASVAARGVALASREEAAIDEAPINPPGGESGSPPARLQRFVQLASPEARELATYLSAVPLTQPVMRLVQRVMMERVRNEHLAEVLLGGILERVTPAEAMVDPDQVEFDFVAGVRELLQNSMTRAELARVLSCASEYVGARFGQPLDFKALVEAQDGALELPDGALPFAHLARQALGRFRPLPEIRALPGATAERARSPSQRPPEALLACCMQVGPLGNNGPVRIAFAVDPKTLISVREPYKEIPFLAVEGSTRQLQIIQEISEEHAARRNDRLVALRSVGWTADEYLRIRDPAPDGDVNVSVNGFDHTHSRWFDGVLQARTDSSHGPRSGLISNPPDLTAEELATVFVGAPVLLNGEVVGAVVDAVRSENKAAVHMRVVESDYLKSVIDRFKPYIALITDDDAIAELIHDAHSALDQHISLFPGVGRFAGMTLRTYWSVDRAAAACLDEPARSAIGLIVLDAAVRARRDMTRAPRGSAEATALLDRLALALPDVPILVLRSTGIDAHGPRQFNREKRKVRELDLATSDFAFAFAKVLHNTCRFSSAPLRFTLRVGEYAARYSLTQGEDEWSRGEYVYPNQAAILSLLRQVSHYTPFADGRVTPDWQSQFAYFGEEIFELFISKTIGERIVQDYYRDRHGSADSVSIELRFDFEVDARGQSALFDVPFELAIPQGYDSAPLCARVPMARRIRFPERAPDDVDEDGNDSPDSATASGSKKRPMRMLFVDARFNGSVELVDERTGERKIIAGLGTLARTPYELQAFKAFAGHKRMRSLESVTHVRATSRKESAAQFEHRLESLVRSNRFDILHFSGISIELPGDGGAFLVLPDKNGKGQGISVRQVAKWVSDAGIRIVTFSSCSGSFWRTSIDVLYGGAEAVLGLRNVDDRLAAEYLRMFYSMYLEGDKSLAEAYCGACSGMRISAFGSPIWASAILVVKD